MFWLALGSSSEAFQAAHGNEQKATSGSDAMPTVSRVHRQASRWVEGHTLAVCFPPYAVKTVLLLGP